MESGVNRNFAPLGTVFRNSMRKAGGVEAHRTAEKALPLLWWWKHHLQPEMEHGDLDGEGWGQCKRQLSSRRMLCGC